MYTLQTKYQIYAVKRSRVRRWVVIIALLFAIVPNFLLLTNPSLPLLYSNLGIVIYEFVSLALMVLLQAPLMQQIVSFFENKFFNHLRVNLGLSLTMIPSKRNLQDEQPELNARLWRFIGEAVKMMKDADRVRVLDSIKRIDVANNGFELGAAVNEFRGTITLSPGLLNVPENEIEVVVAHELGHIYYRHACWGMTIYFVGYVIIWLLSIMTDDYWVMAFVFGLFFLNLISNLYTSQSELEADGYAASILNSHLVLESLLKRIADTNLILFDYPRFDEWFIVGYPSVKRRIDAILKNKIKTAR